MKYLAYFLISMCVCAWPGEIFAQSFEELMSDQPELEFVEKPSTEDCAEGYKCFDFENFKLYLQMRTQYVWLFKVHTKMYPFILSELKKSSTWNEEAAELQKKRADRAEGAYDDLFPKYVDAVQEAEEAKAHSVWGGGLPWLITAGTVGIVVGVVIGVLATNELSEASPGQ